MSVRKINKKLPVLLKSSNTSWFIATGFIAISLFAALSSPSSPTELHVANSSQQTLVVKSHPRYPTSTVAPASSPAASSQTSPSTKTATPTPAAITKPQSVSSVKPQPVVVPSPQSNVSGLTPTTPSSNNSSPPSSPPTTTSYTSTNWSGYMANNGTFSRISASWTATTVTGNGSTTSADATWIGIGGVSTGDLIQVGTDNIVSASGQVSSGAFYELLPNSSLSVPGVNVTAGDSMSASLVQVSSGEWTVSITDNTNNESYTTTVAYASSLSSAEWIEEDPSYSANRQIPFDNFGTASFSAGATTENGTNVTIAGGLAQPITMVNRSDQAIATPSALGGDGASFSVTQS
jgi:hypothetical protein